MSVKDHTLVHLGQNGEVRSDQVKTEQFPEALASDVRFDVDREGKFLGCQNVSAAVTKLVRDMGIDPAKEEAMSYKMLKRLEQSIE